LKSGGRKRRYDDIRSTTATKEQQIEQLEKMLNVSSGKLFSNNIFVLDENVWAKMFDNETKKHKKASEIQNRKVLQDQKQNNTFKNAAIKYFQKTALNGSDIKSFLKHVVQRGGSPIRTKIKDLHEQLN
jgi:hypothetical protein